MSLSAKTDDIFRHAAVIVDKVLKGARPADLPVAQPAIFGLILNLKTARTWPHRPGVYPGAGERDCRMT
jgi:putative tryptophan/tyrosine transport system substrate-binding protein